MNTSEHFAAVAAGLASAIWTLHRGETVIAQMEAARAQQAAEAACIGLTLDDEKITSLSASTRRHLQGLALVIQVQPCINCAPAYHCCAIDSDSKPLSGCTLLHHSLGWCAVSCNTDH